MPGKSKNQWNKTLKFSWGHIIMALALIFISYVVFMGRVYLSGGNFVLAGIIALINFAVLFSIFIGVQRFRAAERRFSVNIVFERILLCLCVPVFFISCFFGPYNHFFGIFRHHEDIETEFSQAIVKSEQLFTEYEEYANARISRYEKCLTGHNLDKATSDAYLKTLKLQLLSENEEKLRTRAVSWIDKNRNAKIWNIYLMGNVDKIMDCIKEWYNTFLEWSEPVLTYEVDAFSFGRRERCVDEINGILYNVAEKCVARQKLQLNTIWTSLLLFVMLLLPYLLQDRNTKASGYYSLFPKGVHGWNIKHKGVSDEKGKGKGVEDGDGQGDIYLRPNGPKDGGKTPTLDDDLYSGTF